MAQLALLPPDSPRKNIPRHRQPLDFYRIGSPQEQKTSPAGTPRPDKTLTPTAVEPYTPGNLTLRRTATLAGSRRAGTPRYDLLPAICRRLAGRRRRRDGRLPRAHGGQRR